MWKKTIRIWRITLTQNTPLTFRIFLLFSLLNVLLIFPLINVFSFLIHNIVNFSFLIYFSKLYLKVKGSEKKYSEEIERLTLNSLLFSYLKHAVALTFATYAMTFILFVFVVTALIVFGFILGTSLLAFGTTLSPLLVVFYLLFLLFIYFSVITSYPSLFARTVIEGKEPRDFFFMFITAPFSKLLWKLSFSFRVLISSLIIGTISLGIFLLQAILTKLFPPFAVFAYFLTFINILLIYLFGVVSISYLIWEKNGQNP